MSLFPIIGGAGGDGTGGRQQPWSEASRGPGAQDGPAAWLSNNSSFQPASADVLQPQAPYGNYATQAEFLRAAERYLDSSSDEDEAGAGEREGRGKGAAGAERHGPDGPGGAAVAAAAAVKGVEYRDRRRGGRGSDSEDGDRGARRSKKRKHKRSSRSRSRSRSRDRKSRRKRRRRRGSSSDSGRGSSGSSSSDSEDERRRRREKERARERDKILRLERAAAAAGMAPRDAAALAAGAAAAGGGRKPPLRGGGGGPQPGDTYFDTRGDLQNLVYECLYGTDVASYYRVDPMGLARGSRARRRMPGQVMAAAAAHGGQPRFRSSMYDTEDEELAEDEKARAAALAARYFGARAAAVERSRRLPRLHLAEAPVLPGAADSRRRGGAGAGAVGSAAAAAGRAAQPRGWLLSKLELGAASGGGGAAAGGGGGAEGYLQQSRMAVPLPAFLPLRDGAAEAAAAATAQEAGLGQRWLPAEVAASLAAAAAGGESSEEWVLRRTREYNTAVREAPGDVAVRWGWS